MIKRRHLALYLSLALIASSLAGCSISNTDSTNMGEETGSGSTEGAAAFEGYIYGEASAVGDDILTVRLGTVETSDERESQEQPEEPSEGEEQGFSLTLTGQEVAIQLKKDTVIESMDFGDAIGEEKSESITLEDISEGDIVSITFDGEGYAETITVLYTTITAKKDTSGGIHAAGGDIR